MFGNKSTKIKAAFGKVKQDINAVNSNINAVKANTNDWIIYLNAENKDLHVKIIQLEAQLKAIQAIIVKSR